MGRKKSSKTKRNEVVSTNNQMDEVKMNQVENEKSGNKSLIEKKNEKFQDKHNELSESNEKLKSNNIDVLDSLCKNVDKKINHEDYGLESLNDQLSPSTHSVLDEIDIDIFKLPKEYSLAHCVAEDLRMGAGIAVDFKRRFGGIGKLIDQKLKIGNVGIVKCQDQYVFYLITKKKSYGKPTMNTMKKALHSLFGKMKEHNLTKLAIPKIGCGLDRLDWSDVRSLIIDIFSGSDIHITVCVPSKLLDFKTPPRLKVFITPTNLWDMKAKTTFILFIDVERVCKKNWTNDIVDKMDAKYPFKENLLKDVKKKKFNSGDITCYNVKNEVIICMFITQNAYYTSLEIGFKHINQISKNYKYMAIQSGSIDEPSYNFEKISWTVLILRSVIYFSELWLCGDVKQTSDKVPYDQYCKNLYGSMNCSLQYCSPTEKENKNKEHCLSFNIQETSNQN